jgi:hypothetical protein
MTLHLLATVLMLAGAPAPQPCLGNADTTAILIRQIRQTFDLTDSTLLAAQGLPPRVTAIRPVQDDSLCTAALAAYNAPGAAHGKAGAREAYVFELDTAAYAVIAAGGVSVYTYFDRDWTWLAGLVDLD